MIMAGQVKKREENERKKKPLAAETGSTIAQFVAFISGFTVSVQFCHKRSYTN